ncbi:MULTISPECIES: response regulator [unclassified Plantibacter]|uniref:response regulator n=1 Tax=unclassified Plantibacter TaxID=2624265 RepID=UPI0007D9F361|nr:response regulator transcription factor [Plantibacter sp. H53]MBD8102834.1 response regulator transcription factor [Plantibacter sp. CFBP 8775]OAN35857.1 DNA-binding response regulator [Plantibacter sp. H53]
MAAEPIRVFLVDDHEIVRRGVAELVSAEPDLEVVGEAATARDALQRIAATRPRIALLDVRLPDGNGVDLCRDLLSEHADLRCIMLTAYDDDTAITAAVLAGASGYVLKDIRGSGLISAIRSVAAGRRLLSSTLAKNLSASLAQEHRDDPRRETLGLRESQILALIADGLTNRQIGDHLGIAEKTVKNYVSSLLSKLGMQRRTQAAAYEAESRARSHPG